MTSQIALFNHKGGVSKTTTTFNLGWMLARKGKTVIIVDCDPQCNLTGMVFGFKKSGDFETIYNAGESGIFATVYRQLLSLDLRLSRLSHVNVLKVGPICTYCQGISALLNMRLRWVLLKSCLDLW